MRAWRGRAAAIGLAVLLVGISAAFVAATVYHLRWLHASELARVRESGIAHARVFEEHLTQTMTLVDQLLRGAADGFDADAPAAQTDALQRLARRAPYLRSLSVIDAEGRIVASSNARNLGRRPPLVALLPEAAADAPLLRIASPWTGHDFDDGRPASPDDPGPADAPALVPVVRPVGGGYALLAAVNPDYFANSVLRTLAPEEGSVEVSRLDGVLLFSTDARPQAAKVGQRRVLPGRDGAAQGATSERSVAGAAFERVFRRSRLYPLVLVVRLPHDAALAAFHDQAIAVLAMVLPAYAAVVGSAVLALRHVRRLERERHEQAMRVHDRLAGRMFEAAAEAIVITDRRHRIVAVNPAFQRLSGYSRDELLGHDARRQAAGEHGAAFFEALWRTLRRDGIWKGELVNRRKDGSPYPVALTLSVVADESGKVSHHVAIFSDISERREREERIRFLSEHDVLTGLPNRALVHDRIERTVASVRRHGGRLAVLFIDLDRFKPINDTLGHGIGDRVLCEIARRLGATVRASDTVGRQGGDEFVVLLPDVGGPDDAARVAEKIIAAVGAACRIDEHELSLGASVGIAVYPDDGSDVEALLRAADAAMYEAKSSGGHAYRFHSLPLDDQARDQLSVEDSLRRALDEGGLQLRFQPVVSLRDGASTAVQAQLRWHDSRFGNVPPSRCVAIAVDTRLIVPIGDWALREACGQVARWRASGLSAITVAVKVSALQFARADFPAVVQAALDEAALPAGALTLEIPEAVLDGIDAGAGSRLQALRQLGVKLTIDEFGNGRFALAGLRRLPLDTIKIDGSLVAGLEGDDEAKRGRCIVGAMIDMAHRLGLKVAAEGVDSAGQFEALRSRGCDEAQGALIQRPLSPQELIDWLHARSVHSGVVAATPAVDALVA